MVQHFALGVRYWQIAMHPKSKDKTTFTTRIVLFQFKLMAFGLCNAPTTFERMMEQMLEGLLRKICIVYLDDNIVYRKTQIEVLNNF